MSNKESSNAQEPAGPGARAEKKIRTIFLASVILCVLILLHMVFLWPWGKGVSAPVRLSLPPALLWALTTSGYAFHCLWQLAREKQQRVEEMAVRDPITGAYSLDFLEEFLQQECERASTEGVPSAIVYVDLVDLDRVNTDFGHAVGNIVLRAAAGLIEGGMRPDDVLGRVGGDEFIVVMPGASSEEAESLAGDIRNGIENYELDLGERGRIEFLGARTGVVSCPVELKTPDEIISMARARIVLEGRPNGEA